MPTTINFLEWQKQVSATNPTFKFILQLTINVALSIYVQRIGDRNNDKKCSDAGRYKFSNMFFAFNHPIYREVEYRELRKEVLFPPEVASSFETEIFPSVPKPARSETITKEVTSSSRIKFKTSRR